MIFQNRRDVERTTKNEKLSKEFIFSIYQTLTGNSTKFTTFLQVFQLVIHMTTIKIL
jgi:hypothetical protein